MTSRKTGLVRVFVFGKRGNVLTGEAVGERKFDTVQEAKDWCRNNGIEFEFENTIQRKKEVEE